MVEFFNLIVEKVYAQGMFSGEHFCADGIAVSGEALLDKNLRWGNPPFFSVIQK